MRKLLLVAAVMSTSHVAIGQTSTPSAPSTNTQEIFNCPTGTKMSTWFESGQAQTLPRYSESSGARVQRQYPKTKLSGQAKHILQADGESLGICEYSNHVGPVAFFLLGGATADAYDEACDDRTCKDGDYWRSDWRQPDAESDKPGQEMIKACYRDVDGRAFPSVGCGFTPKAE